ncbi:MAG: hypothetical protein AAFP92_13640 [Bacteroidota bacterium]
MAQALRDHLPVIAQAYTQFAKSNSLHTDQGIPTALAFPVDVTDETKKEEAIAVLKEKGNLGLEFVHADNLAISFLTGVKGVADKSNSVLIESVDDYTHLCYHLYKKDAPVLDIKELGAKALFQDESFEFYPFRDFGSSAGTANVLRELMNEFASVGLSVDVNGQSDLALQLSSPNPDQRYAISRHTDHITLEAEVRLEREKYEDVMTASRVQLAPRLEIEKLADKAVEKVVLLGSFLQTPIVKKYLEEDLKLGKKLIALEGSREDEYVKVIDGLSLRAQQVLEAEQAKADEEERRRLEEERRAEITKELEVKGAREQLMSDIKRLCIDPNKATSYEEQFISRGEELGIPDVVIRWNISEVLSKIELKKEGETIGLDAPNRLGNDGQPPKADPPKDSGLSEASSGKSAGIAASPENGVKRHGGDNGLAHPSVEPEKSPLFVQNALKETKTASANQAVGVAEVETKVNKVNGLAENKKAEAATVAEPKVETIIEEVIQPAKEEKKEPKVEAKAEPKVEAKAEPKVEVKAEPKVEAKAEPKVEVKAEPKVEAKAEPKVEAKAEPKAEAKAEPKAETKAEPKAETKAEPKAEAKAEPKAEAKAEPKAETKAEPKAETKAEPKAEAKAEPKAKAETAEASAPKSGDQKLSLNDLFVTKGALPDPEFATKKAVAKSDQEVRVVRVLASKDLNDQGKKDRFFKLYEKELKYYQEMSEIEPSQEGLFYHRAFIERTTLKDYVKRMGLDKKLDIDALNSSDLKFILQVFKEVRELPTGHANLSEDNILVVSKRKWNLQKNVEIRFVGFTADDASKEQMTEQTHKVFAKLLGESFYKDFRQKFQL